MLFMILCHEQNKPKIMDNIKRERFLKVATARVSKTLEMLRLLKNCSNKANYDYTQQDVDNMFAVISKSLSETQEAYADGLSKNKSFSYLENDLFESASMLYREEQFLQWLASSANTKKISENTAVSYVSYIKSVNKKLFCKTGHDILAMLPDFVKLGNTAKIDEIFKAMDDKLTQRITDENDTEMPLNSLNNSRSALRRYAEFIKSLTVTE